MPVHTATLKKFSTGSGRANKQDMIKAAKEQGWNPEDDNKADACFLLEYAMNELGVNNIGASVAQVGQEINLNDSGLT
jgi:hypothetical protein